MTAVSNIVIKRASCQDAAAMDSLNRRCLPENYPLVEWRAILTLMPAFSYVAYDGDLLVGYSLGMIQPEVKKGVIASIAVDTSHRRKGIGKDLLLASIKSLEDHHVRSIVLNVRISNVPAQALYKTLGFRKHQLVSKYYQNGEDAYLMKKDVSTEIS